MEILKKLMDRLNYLEKRELISRNKNDHAMINNSNPIKLDIPFISVVPLSEANNPLVNLILDVFQACAPGRFVTCIICTIIGIGGLIFLNWKTIANRLYIGAITAVVITAIIIAGVIIIEYHLLSLYYDAESKSIPSWNIIRLVGTEHFPSWWTIIPVALLPITWFISDTLRIIEMCQAGHQ